MHAASSPGTWPRFGWRLARETKRRELLDEAPASPALAGNLADLRRANRWFGGASLVRHYLQPRIRALPRGSRVTLLDIGTGGGDLPAAFLGWAAETGRQGWSVGTDPSGGVLKTAASELDISINLPPALVLSQSDGRVLPYAEQSFDFVLCALTAHHLDAPGVVTLLSEMARRGAPRRAGDRSEPLLAGAGGSVARSPRRYSQSSDAA
ncbi:MAG: hypothetical protein CL878_01735 [Dehalococcoidia bacterium]|nr:hypothetical protein [Dehalococcoidia bacterium]